VLSTTTADFPIQVLLVDDDPRLRTLLQDELEDEGYQVSTAADAAGAWDQLNHCSPPDLLVLDWSLPDGSGPEVCQRMREAGITLPVLMLTGHDDVTDRVLALDAGVDDYLVKPFSVEELLARLRALQRRRWEAEVEQPDQLLVLGGLSLNLTAETASLSGSVLPLLKKEYDLLVQLLLADGKACSSEVLLLNLWGEAGLASPTILDVYLESIRQKLSTDDSSPRLQLCADDAWCLIEGGGVSA